jgi:hypothetical protein
MTFPAAPRRRWFRFSLRTLFVVVTVLGASLGWLVVQLKWIQDRHEALRWIVPGYERSRAAESGSQLPPMKGFAVSLTGSKVPWSLKIFGELGVERIEVDQEWLKPDARHSLDELKLLFPEAAVTVSPRSHRDPIGNAGVKRVFKATTK